MTYLAVYSKEKSVVTKDYNNIIDKHVLTVKEGGYVSKYVHVGSKARYVNIPYYARTACTSAHDTILYKLALEKLENTDKDSKNK